MQKLKHFRRKICFLQPWIGMRRTIFRLPSYHVHGLAPTFTKTLNLKKWIRRVKNEIEMIFLSFCVKICRRKANYCMKRTWRSRCVTPRRRLEHWPCALPLLGGVVGLRSIAWQINRFCANFYCRWIIWHEKRTSSQNTPYGNFGTTRYVF